MIPAAIPKARKQPKASHLTATMPKRRRKRGVLSRLDGWTIATLCLLIFGVVGLLGLMAWSQM